MQFNTFLYILAFLPITLVGWFAINIFSNTAAKLFLIGVSLFFYSYAGIQGLIWLLISMVDNYGVILLLNRIHRHRQTVLTIGIVFNVVLLLYFKYTNFAIDTFNGITHGSISNVNIILPVGISFFTFQQISYIVDTYRGETAGNTMMDYAIYVLFFPKILMGPIAKQSDLIPQFHDMTLTRVSGDNMIHGIRMFIIGLFKKVILAEMFGRAVDWGFGQGINGVTSMDLILVMIAYTFQIYFDFSGYSDMATGSALMMNIVLPINFDSPYKACSIRDFWKRWHISLTKFLTEYIYIPLGGSRGGGYAPA